MKSKEVSSSESEDSDEGADPDLEDAYDDGQDYKHEEDEDQEMAEPVVAVAHSAAAPVVLPPIRPRNTAALALARVPTSGKTGRGRKNRM